MKPFLSIIIPSHNSSETVLRLLRSLALSKQPPTLEVIVVDDGSEEKFIASSVKRQERAGLIAKRLAFPLPASRFPLRVIRLERNMGPAVARNRGAKAARGKFILFLDSDVEVFLDALHNLAKIYHDDPDIVAVTGVWVKEQKSRAFFPNFKALRDWSYWINERDKSGYYFLFSTRVASIKRSVFLRLGGFDETYPAPLVEDIELTYRIARRYAIIFAPNVRVWHEFESFWPIAKKYFLRAYYWTKLYQRRKKFDPVATTWQEAITTISGVAMVVGIIALVTLLLVGIPFIETISVKREALRIWTLFSLLTFRLTLSAFLLHLFLIRKFLAFLYKEKGLVFSVKGFFVGLVLYCFVFAGALAGKIR